VNNISACGKTDIGRKRHRNDDSYAIEFDVGLFIVADGMGGHPGGDVASLTAVETTRDFLKKALADSDITMPFGIDHSLPQEANILSTGIRLANRRIFHEATGMGTTMVALLILDQKAYICHVGDSRLYRIRNGTIEQLTEDHSLVADEIKRGTITREQAKSYRLRHVITRAIGTALDVECDCKVENLVDGDTFLLCTDGLTGMVEDAQILDVIINNNGIEKPCEVLVRKANEMGGEDNITAVVVRYG
jgi:serine/threonine protein phosphatase PrpC